MNIPKIGDRFQHGKTGKPFRVTKLIPKSKSSFWLHYRTGNCPPPDGIMLFNKNTILWPLDEENLKFKFFPINHENKVIIN